MPSLSIKDVPEPLLEALRRRAARNHRSLQGELMALIAQAADEPTAQAGAPGPTGQKSIEQIAAEHRARWPKPFKAGPRAVDIIRAERDAR
ncbi:MAG: Arc family DNA-binding protein [Rhodocyclaceae bacterium]|nr:Arc family DNA-binding protein [Rhodocyclaceae bacterium]MCO5096471.1 Arc family DNA-binding protein [Rhodocyclaceae bacterium]MCZ7655265.1 Arc family DNA-binding protein [Rhodocyclaceae bacterium]